MKEKLAVLKTLEAKIFEGGGAKASAKQKEKGKMLARERVNYLLDAGTPFAIWEGLAIARDSRLAIRDAIREFLGRVCPATACDARIHCNACLTTA